jgi:transposase
VQKLRTEYWAKLCGVKAEDLVFIDEAGVNLAMVRLYARALRGQRARGSRPQKRGKNVSIIGAITLKNMLAFFNVLGSVDGITFEAFIVRKLVPKLWKGAVVIMDNCSIHQRKTIEKALKKVGARLIYLSPYSPEFSPIENLWSKVKTLLRTLGARTYRALDEALEQAYQQVTEQDLCHWFTHCCYCTSSI